MIATNRTTSTAMLLGHSPTRQYNQPYRGLLFALHETFNSTLNSCSPFEAPVSYLFLGDWLWIEDDPCKFLEFQTLTQLTPDSRCTKPDLDADHSISIANVVMPGAWTGFGLPNQQTACNPESVMDTQSQLPSLELEPPRPEVEVEAPTPDVAIVSDCGSSDLISIFRIPKSLDIKPRVDSAEPTPKVQ